MAKKKKARKDDKEKKPPEGYIIVNDSEDWLKEPIDNEFADSNFMKIILFYVLHSPCKKGSYSRIDLSEYGWNNPWYHDEFKTGLKNIAGFNETNYHYEEAQKDFKECWEKLQYQDNFYDNVNQEYVVFSNAGETNPYMSLFHHIRNSIAHRRFTAQKINRERDYYIIMEDVKFVDGFYRVNARMILRKRTLLKWIDFLECNDVEAKKICQNLSQTNTTNGHKNVKPVSKN